MIGETLWSSHLDDYLNCLEVSVDDSLAVGSLGGDAAIINGNTGEHRQLSQHEMGVLSAKWDPTGQRLAVGGQDGVVQMYGGSGEPVGAIVTEDWVNDLAWSPEESLLAIASGRSLTLANAQAEVLQRCEPLESTITAVAWATTGLRVGAAAYGGIAWYDPERISDGRPTRRHDFKGSALSIALAPSGRWACAGFQDATIHLWKLWSGDDLSMSGYPAKIELLAFDPESNWMVSACLEELTFWDFSGRGPRGRTPARGALHDRHVTAVAWHPTGKYLLSGGADGRVVLWPSPRRRGEDLEPVFVHHAGDSVSRVAWNSNGTKLFLGTANGYIEARSFDA